MKIIAIHLLNDYSGSPKVLMQLLKGWVKNNIQVSLFTSGGRKGFLSDIEGVQYHYFWYQLAENPYLRLLFLTYSQVVLFFKLLLFLKKGDIVYVNTVLPFGAALAGKLRGFRVIYHIHETSMKPKILKKFLFGIVKHTAEDIVYVSQYLLEQEEIRSVRKHLLYNALESSFLNIATLYHQNRKEHRNILMICSLKTYKGVNEFVTLANSHPTFFFKLVVNAEQADIHIFFRGRTMPDNLLIYPVQKETHRFYQWADVVLNLSQTGAWVETFGLTVIEAMAYGLPVIVPPIGGIAELVEDGINGYKIDSKNIGDISLRLEQILNEEKTYNDMSTIALEKVKFYSEEYFIAKSMQIICL